MSLLLNKAHFPVTVLGPGRRVGLWLQGCTIHCFACISRDTWAADPRTAIEVDAVLDWIRSLPVDEVDGVTISGGEPLDQPDELLRLLQGIDEWRGRLDRPVDVLCYSGRGWEEVQRDFQPQLALLDAIVPEPYMQGEPTGNALTGSGNQKVIALSDLGRERYSHGELTGCLAAQRGSLQVEVDDDTIWFIGIPGQSDMSRLRKDAARVGITIGRPSWLL
jgi:anaerobic ribonucleoside-triphosphate reductase activating protein